MHAASCGVYSFQLSVDCRWLDSPRRMVCKAATGPPRTAQLHREIWAATCRILAGRKMAHTCCPSCGLDMSGAFPAHARTVTMQARHDQGGCGLARSLGELLQKLVCPSIRISHGRRNSCPRLCIPRAACRECHQKPSPHAQTRRRLRLCIAKHREAFGKWAVALLCHRRAENFRVVPAVERSHGPHHHTNPHSTRLVLLG